MTSSLSGLVLELAYNVINLLLVQGFRSPRWPKLAVSHWLEVSSSQQCTHWRATRWSDYFSSLQL